MEPFSLNGRDPDKQRRRMKSVRKQEEHCAKLIGGKRHVGSGSIKTLKSDASSKMFQLEAKQTVLMSYGLKAEVLEKISMEARTQMKVPVVHIRFMVLPEGYMMDNDWVVMPEKIFRLIAKHLSCEE